MCVSVFSTNLLLENKPVEETVPAAAPAAEPAAEAPAAPQPAAPAKKMVAIPTAAPMPTEKVCISDVYSREARIRY